MAFGGSRLSKVVTFVGVLPSRAEWEAALATGEASQLELLARIVTSGLAFYLYNEVAMLTLAAVHPITHAVANTIKRVILILFSVVRFGTPLTTTSAVGSAIAIGGVLAYSLAKQRYASVAPVRRAKNKVV